MFTERQKGKYEIIYADPPWQYGSKGARSGKYGELDYPTMPTNEICTMPVKEVTAKNAVLFLWFTGSFMPDAVKVCSSWGFDFKRIDKVWAKKTSKGNRHGVVGPWGMSDCEFLGLGVKGSMCGKQSQRNQFVLVEEEYPGRHSSKPVIFRKLIEERFAGIADKIELFARENPSGWDVWGDFN